MSKKVTPAAFAYLDQCHQSYKDYNQKEPKDAQRMAETGHPFAPDYRKLRAFYDQLMYACNSNVRYYSFKNKAEYSRYWAPLLSLSWNPTGEQFHEFRLICRSDEKWDQYIEAVALAGYPKEAGPQLEGGSWTIHTQFGELVDTLKSLAKAKKIPYVSSTLPQDNETGMTYFEVRIHPDTNEYTVAMHNRIVAAVNKFHRGYILPNRTSEIDAQDNAPLPLEQKKFMTANVAWVTVTDRHVLVPLIPVGSDTTVLEQAVNDVVGLLKQGYPFASASDWLMKWLTQPTFAKLEAEFTAII